MLNLKLLIVWGFYLFVCFIFCHYGVYAIKSTYRGKIVVSKEMRELDHYRTAIPTHV